MSKILSIALLTWLAAAVGCQSTRPIRTADSVDLDRFMGKWYVIAHIPTFIERNAYNAVESYRLSEDGTIETTFSFNEGGFNGPLKVYRPRGFVRDKDSNAVWGMQFVWPFKAEYRIVYISDDYSVTVIGRSKRDYVWLMAREPSLPGNQYARLKSLLEEEGYDLNDIRKVPHADNR